MPDERGYEAVDGPEDERVVDTARWLEERVKSLIETRRFDEAIQYLRLLTLKVDDEERLRQCTSCLGYLCLVVDDLEQSKQWLKRAEELGSADPHVGYALGHVAAMQGAQGLATVHFLESFVDADEPHDKAEFLRSGALAMMKVMGPVEPAAAMLLGALDRDLGNPWILDALARVYEADQRWMESLQTLSVLTGVVRDAAESMVIYRAPAARQLLRNHLMGTPAGPAELHRRARAINEAIREQFEVVLDAHQRRGPTGLAALRFPPALSRLVRMLEWRDRGLELVESAQNLWARATDEKFDEMLGRTRLAAAIHLLVERLHWRMPTPLNEVARLHGASYGAIPAAARVVAGRLQLECFDEAALKATLPITEQRRVHQLGRALLFGERLADVRSGEIRIGG